MELFDCKGFPLKFGQKSIGPIRPARSLLNTFQISWKLASGCYDFSIHISMDFTPTDLCIIGFICEGMDSIGLWAEFLIRMRQINKDRNETMEIDGAKSSTELIMLSVRNGVGRVLDNSKHRDIDVA